MKIMLALALVASVGCIEAPPGNTNNMNNGNNANNSNNVVSNNVNNQNNTANNDSNNSNNTVRSVIATFRWSHGAVSDVMDVPILLELGAESVPFSGVRVEVGGFEIPSEQVLAGDVLQIWVRMDANPAIPVVVFDVVEGAPSQASVWDDYLTVHHFESLATDFLSSTGEYHVTPSADLEVLPSTEGRFGSGIDVPSTGIDLYTTSEISADAGNTLVVEAWYRERNPGGGKKTIVHQMTGCRGFEIYINGMGELVASIGFDVDCALAAIVRAVEPDIPRGTGWHQVVAVYDRESLEQLSLYHDGQLIVTEPLVNGSDATGGELVLGSGTVEGGLQDDWALGGAIDEVRLSRKRVSAEWVALQYEAFDLVTRD